MPNVIYFPVERTEKQKLDRAIANADYWRFMAYVNRQCRQMLEQYERDQVAR